MPITFRVTQRFPDAPDRVFSALTDLERAGEWMPGLVRIDRLSENGTRGLDVGSRWRETRRLYGREATEEFEVTGLEPPSRLALRVDGSRGTSRRGEYLFAYRLEPLPDGGTHLVFDGEIRGLGTLWELVGRLFAGSYRSMCENDLRALADHLDQEQPLAGESLI